MQEKSIIVLLKVLTTGNIVTAIENYEDELKDMNRMYDELVETLKENPADKAAVIALDDLLFVSMKIAFLEGMKFEKTHNKL